MKIGIVGGTGLIGRALSLALLNRKDSVKIFTRSKVVSIPILSKDLEYITRSKIEPKDLDELSAVINLAGENLAGIRWNESIKKEFWNSRVVATESLARSILDCNNPPKILISASAIGYYGSYIDGSRNFQESDPTGVGFLSDLCNAWEQSAIIANGNQTKVRIARIGIVLDPKGGALKKLMPVFRSFLGGKISSGNQGMSWIHIQDIVSAFLFLLEPNREKTVYNLSSPNPVSNNEFTQTLGMVLNRPTILGTPAWVMEGIFGEGSKIVTEGQFVLPYNLIQEGFSFRYPDLKQALQNLIL
jgi:uncharacterized protein (TIGR01777 family)